jgi:predicted N-formylglutamate amidohydrolase
VSLPTILELRPLLGKADPPPVGVLREAGSSDVLLLGDHAGRAIPASLGDLGLPEDDRRRHIAWDLGVRELGEEVAAALDATFIWQPFSRLVIDCNRDPRSKAAIPEVSDETPVPANAVLGEGARRGRYEEIHRPYHERIASEIASRRARGRRPVLVALHSFTPLLANRPRPWDVGILHDGGDSTLSLALLRTMKSDAGVVVGDNEPYRMDSTDYTIPRHAYPGALPYVEIEFRQDLLEHSEGVRLWATRFVSWLRDSM